MAEYVAERASAWAGTARGLWTAEMCRQQTAMMNEMTRQMVQFWTGAWMAPSSGDRTRRRR